MTETDRVDHDPLAETAAALSRHQRFHNAVRHYAESALDWRARHPRLAKSQASHARSSIVGYLMYLHYAADPANPDDGPNYLKLLALCRQRQDCGPRVLQSTLALLRLTGYVQQSRGQADRRLRLYRPTEKMISFVRDWYGCVLGCFDRLNRHNQFAARVRADAGFIGHVVAAISPPYLGQDIKLVARFPALFELFSYDAGFPLVALLALAAIDGAPPPSSADIARRFGLSATQVRKVLKLIEAKGLADPRNGALRDMFAAYVARELALYARYALPAAALALDQEDAA